MGVCQSEDYGLSTEQRRRDKKFNRDLQDDMEQESHKVLLLGAGESGKSTFFKQVKLRFGSGFDDAGKKQFVGAIHCNIISAIQALCRNSDKFAQEGVQGTAIDDEKVEACKAAVMKLHPIDDRLTPEMCEKISALWANKGIQATYGYRGRYYLYDSASYFFERLKQTDLCGTGYTPSEQDVVRARVRTTGILEQNYEYKGNKFMLFDVGGQRNERRKWFHLFENVTAVLFIASLSAYNQSLYEDAKRNRMIESLELFEEICSLKVFEDTDTILFLNKIDLYQEQIKKTPLTVCFPDFGKDGFEFSSDDEDSKELQYIKAQFEARNLRAKRAQKGKGSSRNGFVRMHITNATDPENVERVFTSCQEIIITRSLQDVGLLGGQL